MSPCRRWLLGGLAVASLAATSGCYKATFYRDPSVVSGSSHEEWSDFFLFGLVGSEVIDVRKYCPADRTALIRTGANVGTGLVSVVTLGIYTPRKIYVTCASPAPAERTTTAALRADGASKEVAP